eukprot:5862773-Pyramimonas_sp.AAC.1
MGVCTRPPQLALITEHLPRGSLHRLLHRRQHERMDLRRKVLRCAPPDNFARNRATLSQFINQFAPRAAANSPLAAANIPVSAVNSPLAP